MWLSSPTLAEASTDDDYEDLNFLGSNDDGAAKHTHQSDPHHFGSDDEPEDDNEDFENLVEFYIMPSQDHLS
nr:protein disulfide isomerase-like 1-4 [Ipomoea trifida]